ncbi:MAG: tetratricopeptide repeat protein, partial [Pirellulales bacterium]|nr:tetratricopeptide repeat protein [Pirellulales bacterium]
MSGPGDSGPGDSVAATLLPAALADHQAGRLDEAERAYRTVLQVEPEQVDALRLLGLLEQQTGRTEAALAHLTAAVRLRPDLGQLHFEQAGLLKTHGRLAAAVEAYRQAVRLLPELAEAHNNLGNTLALLGRTDEAIAALRRAVELNPNFAAARFNLANLLQGEHRLDEAVDEYRLALASRPDYAEAHFNLGSALAAQERHDEAQAAFARAAQLRPDAPLWTLRAAVSYPTLFDSAEQEAALNRCLLNALNRLADARLTLDPAELVHAGGLPPYNFHFTKTDVRPLKESYARVFAHCFPDETPSGSGSRRRIGLVVTAGSESVFLRSMQGLLERIERGRFEFTVVCPGPSVELLRGQFTGTEIGFLPWAGRFGDVVETIRRARFDLLYYREV